MNVVSLLVGIIVGMVIGLVFSMVLLKRKISELADRYQQTIDGKLAVVSRDILLENNKIFLDTANTKLGAILADAEGKISQSKTEIKSIVDPLKEKLDKYQELVNNIESKRTSAYTSIDERLKALAESQKELEEVTNHLTMALKNPQVRGRWGEITLQRLVELAGMVEYCDFETQVTAQAEDDRYRPDMVIRLPSGRQIVVDSKVPLNAYLESLEAKSENDQKEKLRKHASDIRSHIRLLSGKEYWRHFSESPDFVIMFIPGESFLYAALQEDRDIIEDGMKNRVLISTPTSLISLLKTIALGWSEKKMEENARKIAELGRELYDRLSGMRKSLADMGKKIESSVKAYNTTIGKFEGNVLVTARKFTELGIGSESENEQMEQVSTAIREISSGEVASDEAQEKLPE